MKVYGVRMKTKESFEKEFYEEEIELLVLMKEKCVGAAVCDKKWLRPSVNFLASVNCRTGELMKNEGILTWLIKNEENRKNFGYDFKQYGIYKVLVRKNIPVELRKYQSEIWNNRFMLVKLIESDVSNKDLQELKEYYLKPVTIESDMGIFNLNRQYSCFECEVDWNGADVSVFLETDEDCDETALTAMAAFLRCAKDKNGFDQRNREFAAQKLLTLANEWMENDEIEEKSDEITKEMFIDKIEMSEITVNSDGSITLFYYDGDMFWGHSIEIDIDENGNYDNAHIVG